MKLPTHAPLSFLYALPLAFVATSAHPAKVGPRTARQGWTQERLERIAEEIKEDIEALRQQEFKEPIQVELQDKDGLIRYMQERQDAFEPLEKRVAAEELAKLCGLVPATLDLEAELEALVESQAGGFYDPETDTFYLMESFADALAKPILAHELVHALDDQWYDLDGGLRARLDSTDALQAFRSATEGSAEYVAQAWVLGHRSELDLPAILKLQQELVSELDGAPAFLWKSLYCAYTMGIAFIAAGYKRDVEHVAEHVFESPPRSMEQVLHPTKYWDAEERDEPRPVTLMIGELREGWEVRAEDTYGELYLAMMAGPPEARAGLDASNPMTALTTRYTNDAGEGWDGDRVVLLGKGDARAARLVSVWDTPEDAREFRDALAESFASADDEGFASEPVRRVRLAGEAVVVVDLLLGADEAVLAGVAFEVGEDPDAADRE